MTGGNVLLALRCHTVQQHRQILDFRGLKQEAKNKNWEMKWMSLERTMEKIDMNLLFWNGLFFQSSLEV